LVLRLSDLLNVAGYAAYAAILETALEHSSKEEFLSALNSNDIWGGAGSIADQAFSPVSVVDANRAEFARLMTALADFMLDCDAASNERVRFWHQAFRRT